MKEAEEEILEGITKDPPKVVVRDRNASVAGINLVSYMSEINSYIENDYEVVDTIESTEILIRK
jgi:DNA polymerase II large subunit